ncbi:MAG: membrane protein [Gemmatimonadota bacterium]
MISLLLRSRLFWLDLARLQVGFFLFGLAIALMLEAQIGLDPWSAFHDVASRRSGWSFGRISQVTGLVLIVGSRVMLAVRPGIATVLNMLSIGPWVDVIRPFVGFADGFGSGVLQFLFAIPVLGMGTAVYVGASLGAGPRDGLAMGLSRRIGKSLRASRTGVEVTVLLVAVALGGSIGWGTVIFALLMGPTMQTCLRLFRVSHDPSPVYRRYGVHTPCSGEVG